ncbi:heme oxygenase 1, chloroplastic [Lolium perenne]|uniref:heme oxygenase 1, chloroplastic n=1 Tax=Lolium perenne TaxID=4522 RepID=UPI0021F5F93C|nr:heme oxygenase 1, chloroplastic-like [Lolium perenne]
MASAAATSLPTLASPRVSFSVSAAGKNSNGLPMSAGARRVPGISVIHSQRGRMVAAAAAATKMPPSARGEDGEKTFVEEMKDIAMSLHTEDQARTVNLRNATVEGYLRFLVDSKLVFETLENIVNRAVVPFPWYAEFQNTGLERSEALKNDLKWFREQGHTIPEPSAPGTKHAAYLKELSEKDSQAFLCHFYSVYFAQSAGGRMIGAKIDEKILNKKELEFYKWEGSLSQLLQDVRAKLNQVASTWSQEEKKHCLEEVEMAFTYSMDRLRHIFT